MVHYFTRNFPLKKEAIGAPKSFLQRIVKFTNTPTDHSGFFHMRATSSFFPLPLFLIFITPIGIKYTSANHNIMVETNLLDRKNWDRNVIWITLRTPQS